MTTPTHRDISLALVKAIQEVAEQVEELAKAEENYTNHPHYKAFYEGARSAGADHRFAHKNAKQYVKKLSSHGTDPKNVPVAHAQDTGRMMAEGNASGRNKQNK